ncbi:MAG: hypothetical protein ACRD52_09430, partial [Candidatus Acidiferrales bacterium]
AHAFQMAGRAIVDRAGQIGGQRKIRFFRHAILDTRNFPGYVITFCGLPEVSRRRIAVISAKMFSNSFTPAVRERFDD